MNGLCIQLLLFRRNGKMSLFVVITNHCNYQKPLSLQRKWQRTTARFVKLSLSWGSVEWEESLNGRPTEFGGIEWGPIIEWEDLLYLHCLNFL